MYADPDGPRIRPAENAVSMTDREWVEQGIARNLAGAAHVGSQTEGEPSVASVHPPRCKDWPIVIPTGSA
jgi:hypothetical protein